MFVIMKKIVFLFQFNILLVFSIALNSAFGDVYGSDKRIIRLEEAFGIISDNGESLDNKLLAMKDITNIKIINNEVIEQNCSLFKLKSGSFDTSYEDMLEMGRHRSNVMLFDTSYEDMLEMGRHRSNVMLFDTSYEDMLEMGRHRSNVMLFDTSYEDMLEMGRHRSNVVLFDTSYEDMLEMGRHRSNVVSKSGIGNYIIYCK